MIGLVDESLTFSISVVGEFGVRYQLGRSAGVDLARTLAIVGVVLVHSGCFNNGRFGVQLFFLVSGYLLADLGNLSTRDFLVRRILRLFPLYWLILILFYKNTFNSFWQLLGSMLLIQSVHWNFDSFPGAWSISNEWLFSLLLPLIKNLGKKQILGLILVSWLGQFLSSYIVYKWGGVSIVDDLDKYAFRIWLNTLNPAINITFLLIGVCLRNGFLPLLSRKSLAFFIVILAQLTTQLTGMGLLFIWPFVLWAIFSMCVNWSPKSKFLESIVAFIGQRTYGIFFVHFMVLEYLRENVLIGQLLGNLRSNNLIFFALTLLISTVVSEVSWRFIESPCIKFSRWLIKILK
jgi:peptidoglycan/LPS O-acetylase OafA/YrhL